MVATFKSFLGDATAWDLVHQYGSDGATPPTIHQFLRLKTTGAGILTAPIAGKLSIKPPGGGQLDPSYTLFEAPNLTAPAPDRLTVYLHVSPVQELISKQIATRTAGVGRLLGFFFTDVDPTAFKTALADAFKNTTLSVENIEKVGKKKKAVKKNITLTPDQGLSLFASGDIQIPVIAGQEIGRAAPSVDGPGNSAGIAAVTRFGLVDPLATYAALGDLVFPDVPSTLQRFYVNNKTGWPVFTGTANDVATAATGQIYPYPAFAAAKQSMNIDVPTWRTIRDRQKAIFLRRLLVRVGRGGSDPVFEYDTFDWRNPFQLEAVAEFYANFPKPWDPATAPVSPTDPSYQVLDLQNYGGSSISISKQANNTTTLSLPAAEAGFLARMASDLEYGAPKPGSTTQFIRPAGIGFQNSISLSADTASTTKRYVITSFNPTSRTITVKGKPTFTGNSVWELHRRSFFIFIDPFGGRLSGNNAQVTGQDTISLGTTAAKINAKWDTIYLAGDTGAPSKTYRIRSVAADGTLTVVGRNPGEHPTLGAPSRWRIPAGLGWSIEALNENLGIGVAGGENRGFDHFDAMLFVAKDGAVHYEARWNTFTSRNNKTTNRNFQSSASGNKRYRFYAIRSPNQPDIHYAFSVDTPTAGLPNFIQGALFYFDPLRNNDPVSVDSDANGPRKKGGVRIHFSPYSRLGGHGCTSSGCWTSPNIFSMRDAMIELAQDERLALGLERDAALDGWFYHAGQADSIAVWQGTKTNKAFHAFWNYKIAGWIWLIRPEELHEGSNP